MLTRPTSLVETTAPSSPYTTKPRSLLVATIRLASGFASLTQTAGSSAASQASTTGAVSAAAADRCRGWFRRRGRGRPGTVVSAAGRSDPQATSMARGRTKATMVLTIMVQGSAREKALGLLAQGGASQAVLGA